MIKVKIESAETPEIQKRIKHQELHHHRAEEDQKCMGLVAEMAVSPNTEALVISFDVQQQMFVPQLTHSQ